jgi:hypothetical protein
MLVILSLVVASCERSEPPRRVNLATPNTDMVLLTTHGSDGGEVVFQSGRITVRGERFRFDGLWVSSVRDPAISERVNIGVDSLEKARADAKALIQLRPLRVNGVLVDTGGVRVYRVWEAYSFLDGVIAVGLTSIPHEWAEPSDLIYVDMRTRLAAFSAWKYKTPVQLRFWNPHRLLSLMHETGIQERD